MQILKKIDSVLAKVLEAFCVACMILLFLIMILKVFFRFVPILSLFPGFSTGMFDEFTEWLFSWLILTCSTLLCRNNAHFRVDLLSERLRGTRVGGILDALCYLVALAFYVLLLYYSFKLCTGAVQTSPLLRWPKAVFYACVPLNSFLMAIYTVVHIVRCIRCAIHPEKA